jgi:hypothetical protein
MIPTAGGWKARTSVGEPPGSISLLRDFSMRELLGNISL